MAGTITLSPTEPSVYSVVTMTGAGFSASTDHVVSVATPDGGADPSTVTTDGSGAFTFSWTPNTTGSHSVTATPVGVLAATTTFQVVD